MVSDMIQCYTCKHKEICDYSKDVRKAMKDIESFVSSDKREAVRKTLMDAIDSDCDGYKPEKKTK